MSRSKPITDTSKFKVQVETAVKDWHKGSIKTVKKTWTPEIVVARNVLTIPLDARGETYVRILIEPQPTEKDS